MAGASPREIDLKHTDAPAYIRQQLAVLRRARTRVLRCLCAIEELIVELEEAEWRARLRRHLPPNG